MRTALGALLSGLAATLVALSVALGTLGPALAAVGLLGGLEAARRHAVRRSLQADRQVPVLRIGEPSTVFLAVRSTGPWRLRVEDHLPAGMEGEAKATGIGHVQATYTVIPRAAGEATWRSMTVHVGDRWGLWDVPRRIHVASTAPVRPETEHAVTGRRQGRRYTVLATARSRRGSPQPEVETTRRAEPFDRLRDIDWKRTALMQTLVAKERERASPRSVLLLLDARRSMRLATGTSKATTAARLALGIVSAAKSAGTQATVFVHRDDSVVEVPGTMQSLMHQLGRIPAPVEQAIRLEHGVPRPPSDAERLFLSQVAFVAGGTSRPTFDVVLSRLMAHEPAFVVLILDAEVRPREAEVAVKRLRRKGHRVVLIVPATGAHHVRRAEADLHLPVLREALLRRARLARAIAPAPLLVARPGNDDEIIQEVARRAQR